jgi:hypothetical protein
MKLRRSSLLRWAPLPVVLIDDHSATGQVDDKQRRCAGTPHSIVSTARARRLDPVVFLASSSSGLARRSSFLLSFHLFHIDDLLNFHLKIVKDVIHLLI